MQGVEKFKQKFRLVSSVVKIFYLECAKVFPDILYFQMHKQTLFRKS
jgi:hypothetical protein